MDGIPQDAEVTPVTVKYSGTSRVFYIARLAGADGITPGVGASPERAVEAALRNFVSAR